MHYDRHYMKIDTWFEQVPIKMHKKDCFLAIMALFLRLLVTKLFPGQLIYEISFYGNNLVDLKVVNRRSSFVYLKVSHSSSGTSLVQLRIIQVIKKKINTKLYYSYISIATISLHLKSICIAQRFNIYKRGKMDLLLFPHSFNV